MADAVRFTRRVRSFGRRWGLPTVLGAACGLGHVALATDPLVDRLGPAGAALACLSGIGLGLLVAVFALLPGRLAAPTPNPAA